MRGSDVLKQLEDDIPGVFGDEAIRCVLDVMYTKAPYTVLQRSVNIHSTVAELVPTILGELKPMA